MICAQRSTVFRYFTDSKRFADWWGAGSVIEARPGGEMKIVYPNGIVARGEVVEVDPDRRIVFTYGYEDASQRIPPGSSRVTVTLEDRPEGTWLTLKHDLAEEKSRDHHVQGWRYQLALFANVAASEQNGYLAQKVDRYFALWGEADAVARRRGLSEVASANVMFQDRYSCTAGLDDLDAHLTASRIYMPGITLVRVGDARQCQGAALADWEARDREGKAVGKGTNLFVLSPEGKITRVVGFWAV
jgi:uncharacterized protein YndB with AHSA1/START domain